MPPRKPQVQQLTLADKTELALMSLLDSQFGHIVNPQDEQAASPGSGTLADQPPPNMLDQLRLIKAVTDFIHLKHRIDPDDGANGIDGMVEILRGATQRQSRRPKAENGTPALLHRADEPTGAPDPD